jgi:hypothetical protein
MEQDSVTLGELVRLRAGLALTMVRHSARSAVACGKFEPTARSGEPQTIAGWRFSKPRAWLVQAATMLTPIRVTTVTPSRPAALL